MSDTGLLQIIEGALLAAGKPLTVAQLGDLFEEHERPENTAIREALEAVAERCDDRGFELQEVSSGFRFQVRQSLSPWVGRLWHERPQKYSRALLETLALIAYRQPITRGEIEEIRGVAVSSNIIKTLHEREWVRVVGHRDVPGRPAMYATTRQFLDYFNLKSLDQLPALAEIRDLETLNAELGFEPLAEPAAEPEDVPGLTVVGGTEHTPQSEPESRSEAADGDAAADGGEGMSLSQAVDDLESRAHDAVPEESEVADAQEANSEHDADHAQDLEGAAEVQNIDKAEPIEERAMYAEDLDAFEDTDSPKPESQS